MSAFPLGLRKGFLSAHSSSEEAEFILLGDSVSKFWVAHWKDRRTIPSPQIKEAGKSVENKATTSWVGWLVCVLALPIGRSRYEIS